MRVDGSLVKDGGRKNTQKWMDLEMFKTESCLDLVVDYGKEGRGRVNDNTWCGTREILVLSPELGHRRGPEWGVGWVGFIGAMLS